MPEGWIARDHDGTLAFFVAKPDWQEDEGYWKAAPESWNGLGFGFFMVPQELDIPFEVAPGECKGASVAITLGHGAKT